MLIIYMIVEVVENYVLILKSQWLYFHGGFASMMKQRKLWTGFTEMVEIVFPGDIGMTSWKKCLSKNPFAISFYPITGILLLDHRKKLSSCFAKVTFVFYKFLPLSSLILYLVNFPSRCWNSLRNTFSSWSSYILIIWWPLLIAFSSFFPSGFT